MSLKWLLNGEAPVLRAFPTPKAFGAATALQKALSLRSAQSGVGASLCHRTPQGLRFKGAVAAMFSESGPLQVEPCRSAPPKAVSALRFATALHKACGSKGRLQQCSASQGVCKSSPVAPLRPKRCRRFALPPHSTRPAVRRGGCSNVQRIRAFASRALSLRSAQSGVGAALCHRTPQGLRFAPST